MTNQHLWGERGGSNTQILDVTKAGYCWKRVNNSSLLYLDSIPLLKEKQTVSLKAHLLALFPTRSARFEFDGHNICPVTYKFSFFSLNGPPPFKLLSLRSSPVEYVLHLPRSAKWSTWCVRLNKAVTVFGLPFSLFLVCRSFWGLFWCHTEAIRNYALAWDQLASSAVKMRQVFGLLCVLSLHPVHLSQPGE